MLRLLIVLISLLTVYSFHVSNRNVQYQSLTKFKMNYENEIGAQPPLGFWDPLGLLKNANQGRFDRLRYVETKHGRICMLAIVGHMVMIHT